MKRLPYWIRKIGYDIKDVVVAIFRPEYPKQFWHKLDEAVCGRIRRSFKWLFRPYNQLHIRNAPRSYMDKDYLMFHACFTLLCNFVEREFTRTPFNEYVKWCEEEWAKPVNEFGYKDMPEHQYESAVLFKELYDWYTGIDWNNPVPGPGDHAGWDLTPDGFKNKNTPKQQEAWDSWHKREDEFHKLCQTNLERLVAHRQSMWT